MQFVVDMWEEQIVDAYRLEARGRYLIAMRTRLDAMRDYVAKGGQPYKPDDDLPADADPPTMLPGFDVLTQDYGFGTPDHRSLQGSWRWEGNIGQGSNGYAGIWLQYDATGNLAHRVVIKDTYMPGPSWDYPQMWYDLPARVPNEVALAQKLNNCVDSSINLHPQWTLSQGIVSTSSFGFFLGAPDLLNWRGIPTAKLGDFGLITEIRNGGIGRAGTDGYIAPEREDAEDTYDLNQSLSDPTRSTASDIWSIGRIMHSLMNLHQDVAPFYDLETDENKFPIYSEGVRDYYGDVAWELLELVEGCLATDPQQRITTRDLWGQIQDEIVRRNDLRRARLAAGEVVWYKRDPYALWAR
ncbi:uncharacterized protein RCC_12215 [Ramularia collo-cygni]|uniref:Protein kinase domain-containing protein n=1 Tax=Ramularia collo-cygni TaxID=112498 RepID=A0A2D3US69_9PEZI|nr:uncharacterized protein RCC_12215 [Ramularia collo-cygni]CZT16535.1 uncharacterized protein RCC_12215 [Ramularia collo-cygni]